MGNRCKTELVFASTFFYFMNSFVALIGRKGYIYFRAEAKYKSKGDD
jgi:hypothetical protein